MTGTLLAPVRHLVRLVLEAQTPFSIASGETDGTLDAPLFRDWNGLPCLSATAIAGVLRSLSLDYWQDERRTNAIFGFERDGDQGAESRLLVSFGMVHDQNGQPIDGYIGLVPNDDVLKLLAEKAPVLRDHVAITHRGAASENLKFDRCSCPRGTRFSLELALDGAAADTAVDRAALLDVIRLFASPYARFGGAVRRGLGKLKVIRASYAGIDRRGQAGRERWIAYRSAPIGDVPAALGFTALAPGELSLPAHLQSTRAPQTGELRLSARFFWRMGKGTEPWGPVTDNKAPDVSPLSERVIVWSVQDGRAKGSVAARPLAPVAGSGIKGPIAHRTEYHLRRLRGQFGAATDERLADDLFGSARAATDAKTRPGNAGAFMIEDAYLDFGAAATERRTAQRTRNSIDRHAGGVRLGKLFTDEVLWRGPELVIPFVLLNSRPVWSPEKRRWTLQQLPADVMTALQWSLDDLCEGRLALGAREAAGDGTFEGRVIWHAADGADAMHARAI